MDLTRYGKDGVGFMHTKAVDVDQGCVVKYACVRNPDLIIASLAETSVINIFDTNDGNVLAHLSGHRGMPSSHRFYKWNANFGNGGGGQGDANLRVWPLADFFDSVTRICARRIVKQEGDSLLEKLHSQIQLATSPENSKGVSWKTGKVIGINRSGKEPGVASALTYNTALSEIAQIWKKIYSWPNS